MAETVLEPQQKKTRLMTEGSIWKNILLFSVPLILGNLLQQLYNTADSIIVGNFVGSNALAAVGSSGSPIFLLIGFSQGIAVGAGVVVAQFLGAKDRKEAQEAVHTSLALATILGLILTVGGILVSRSLLTAMDTPAEVLEDAVLYMQLYFGGVLFSVVYNMAAGILNAAGNSQRSLIYLGVASVTNIILDLVLIAGLKMGVAGAAVATVAQALEVAGIREHSPVALVVPDVVYVRGPRPNAMLSTLTAPRLPKELLTAQRLPVLRPVHPAPGLRLLAPLLGLRLVLCAVPAGHQPIAARV